MPLICRPWYGRIGTYLLIINLSFRYLNRSDWYSRSTPDVVDVDVDLPQTSPPNHHKKKTTQASL